VGLTLCVVFAGDDMKSSPRDRKCPLLRFEFTARFPGELEAERIGLVRLSMASARSEMRENVVHPLTEQVHYCSFDGSLPLAKLDAVRHDEGRRHHGSSTSFHEMGVEKERSTRIVRGSIEPPAKHDFEDHGKHARSPQQPHARVQKP